MANNLTPRTKRRLAWRMRHHPTPAEAILWDHLRGGQLGCRFLTQEVLFGYIPDFVCYEKRVVVEVDGHLHLRKKGLAWDSKRDAVFLAHGYRTLRFPAARVAKDTVNVLAEILGALR